MPRGRKIKLDNRVFGKHGDALAHYQEILNRYPIGGMVIGTDKEDLKALLNRHNEKDEKIGSGISHFIVDHGPSEYDIPTRCFWIIRTDGSRIDFSIKHCLEARPEDSGD